MWRKGELARDPQLYAIIRRMNQILLGSKVSLCRLHGGVAKQQLDLLKLPAAGPAHLRAGTPVMPHAA